MYIAIEGVIGVGKTTLARLLQDKFDAELQLEVFEENPFLADFYGDRERYAFQTQIFFLLSRYHQQRRSVREVFDSGKNLITDYTFAKDALFAQINLHGDELDMYYKVHDALGEKVRLPDLIVHLTADLDTVMERIATRDRSYERNMQRDYIETLAQAYQDFFEYRYQGPKVLTVDTTRLNIVKKDGDLAVIEKQVEEALEEVMHQPELPLDGLAAGEN
jgi:deoxyguanosine kinase